MALAAAVLKAVNSSLYGLKGRVQSVHQAITYLGMREVAAITYEMGLRAAFPPAVGQAVTVLVCGLGEPLRISPKSSSSGVTLTTVSAIEHVTITLSSAPAYAFDVIVHSAAQMDAYTGRFESAELGTAWTLAREGDALRVTPDTDSASCEVTATDSCGK